MDDLLAQLTLLYGSEQAPRLLERVRTIIETHRRAGASDDLSLSERDSILITYADQIHSSAENPLATLSRFCSEHLRGVVSAIHLLPFFPSTSDDGFSVVDYHSIDAALGTWQDIAGLHKYFHLMFDAVINHLSAHSEWFRGFLRDEPRFKDYFIVVDGAPDLSAVVRPRALPLLTAFETASGTRRLWTTFSADQIDLNYKNPEVLIEILQILLGYLEHGARFLRLDAIAYLWKQIGTSCVHLPQTHLIIQFLRAALTDAAPQVRLITETNVPHADNISYFGNGSNESHLVYNFALPPLILHTFQRGDARRLSEWAESLERPSAQVTFFNFLASHDGIGLNAARGILSDQELGSLVEKTIEHGGFVSYNTMADGGRRVYELNINYFDALSIPLDPEPIDVQVDRFMAAQAIMLALIGVPGIYVHSLLGSRGWPAGVEQTGRNRTINREKFELHALEHQLNDPDSIRARVFTRYRALLHARANCRAFDPYGAQKILRLHEAVFAVERFSADANARALCLHNVSARQVVIHTNHASATDLISYRPLDASAISLNGFQCAWIQL